LIGFFNAKRDARVNPSVFAVARLREWLAGAKIGPLFLRSAPYGARKMQKQSSDFRKTRRTALYLAEANHGED
jgi:hypothetical protein